MSLKLVAPREGKTPFWAVRGTHLGVKLDRSTKTPSRATAAAILRKWKDEIERGVLARPGEPTFLDAAVKYMAATGNERFLQPIVDRIGSLPLRSITQVAIDDLALELYPNVTAATRNRQVYTVVSAVLKQAGIETPLRRPKGSRGKERVDWLKPEQAFRVFDCARAIDPEFEIFLITLCYTGLRLGEALGLLCDRLELAEQYAFVAETKNDDPRGVFLPPVVVAALANHPRGLNRTGQRVFRFRKCGRLYSLLKAVRETAGPDVSFMTFHTFRHTWGTWMRRHGGLDAKGLVATGAWRDEKSASRYAHAVVSEEARRAEQLPVDFLRKTASGTRK